MEAEEQLRTPLPLPCMFNCMSMQTEEQKKQGRLENEDINSQMSSCCIHNALPEQQQQQKHHYNSQVNHKKFVATIKHN